MALSDELLDYPKRLAAVRREIAALVSELGAGAGFLVDEAGAPFATVGHMEFQFPHPLTHLGGGDAVLGALLGETGNDESPYLVERVGRRALLALSVDPPHDRAARRRVRATAKAIAALL